MGVSQRLSLPAPVPGVVVANSSLSQISGAQARAQGLVLANPLCGAPSGLVGQMGTWVSMANRQGGRLRKRCRQGRLHMHLLQEMTGLGGV